MQAGTQGSWFCHEAAKASGGPGPARGEVRGYTAPGCDLSCRPGVASLGSNLSPASGSSAFLGRMGLATLSYTHYIFINGLFTSFGLDYF